MDRINGNLSVPAYNKASPDADSSELRDAAYRVENHTADNITLIFVLHHGINIIGLNFKSYIYTSQINYDFNL